LNKQPAVNTNSEKKVLSMEDQVDEVTRGFEDEKDDVKNTSILTCTKESNSEEETEMRGAAVFTNIAPTSSTNVSHVPNSPLLSDPPSITSSSIPTALPSPASSSPSSEPVAIFIDLETTGLHPIQDVQPVQIAARAVVGSLVRTFDKYMIPSVSIEIDASRVHKLYVQGGQLVRLVNGMKEELEGVVSVATGLELFWDWVEEMAGIQPRQNVFLVCYAFNKFDFQVLKFNMKRENMMIPSSLEGRLVEIEPMAGFQRKLGVKSRRLADVVREVLGKEYQLDAHDARHDVEALHLFLKKLADREGILLTKVLAMDTRKTVFKL